MSDGKMTIDSGQVIALLDHARKNDTMGPWSEVAVQCIRAGEKLITDLKTQMAEVTSQRDAAERVWRDEIAEHEKTQARLAGAERDAARWRYAAGRVWPRSVAAAMTMQADNLWRCDNERTVDAAMGTPPQPDASCLRTPDDPLSPNYDPTTGASHE